MLIMDPLSPQFTKQNDGPGTSLILAGLYDPSDSCAWPVTL